jgi:hypothetical protein
MNKIEAIKAARLVTGTMGLVDAKVLVEAYCLEIFAEPGDWTPVQWVEFIALAQLWLQGTVCINGQNVTVHIITSLHNARGMTNFESLARKGQGVGVVGMLKEQFPT